LYASEKHNTKRKAEAAEIQKNVRQAKEAAADDVNFFVVSKVVKFCEKVYQKQNQKR